MSNLCRNYGQRAINGAIVAMGGLTLVATVSLLVGATFNTYQGTKGIRAGLRSCAVMAEGIRTGGATPECLLAPKNVQRLTTIIGFSGAAAFARRAESLLDDYKQKTLRGDPSAASDFSKGVYTDLTAALRNSASKEELARWLVKGWASLGVSIDGADAVVFGQPARHAMESLLEGCR